MRLRFKRVTTPQGFSLVEVLIALVILGVGLLGLARLQMHMLGGTAESVVRDSAVRLAEDKLEALRFDLAAGRAPQAGADEPKVNQIVLQRSWTWSNTGNGLAETTITMRWVEPGTGEAASLSLPARLLAPSLAAQAWLIQSGPPGRETLP
ncbi:MAG: type IV pilus modification PilV family protein [Fluviibacter sp.]